MKNQGYFSQAINFFVCFGLIYWIATPNLWLCFFIAWAFVAPQLNIISKMRAIRPLLDELFAEVESLKNENRELSYELDNLKKIIGLTRIGS
jgi:hypothetical protein